jgi:hypothetical protein
VPLRSGFVRHGVLAPSMAVAATHAPVRAAAVAASTESTTLPRLQLSVAEYGLGFPSIVVYAAAELKRLQAAGAAPAVRFGNVDAPGRQCPIRSPLDPVIQILDVAFEVCLVVLPCQPIHTRRGVFLEFEERVVRC